MSRLGQISRRAFMLGSVAIAGGVAFGFYQYKKPYPNPLEATLDENEITITPYIKIDPHGVTIIAPRAEMGQGVRTTLAALVAEELDVDLEQIQIEHGPASKAYFNGAVLEEGLPYSATDNGYMATTLRDFIHVPAKFIGMQITGGSSSIPDAFEKMRIAGAVARDVLLSAASMHFNQPKSTLETESGRVVSQDGKAVLFEQLADIASTITPPKSVTLKDPKQWKILGKSVPRDDMVPKCTGHAEFGIDVQLPDMRYATIKMNPHLGAKMASFNADKALKSRGIEDVLPIGDEGFAVVGKNTWYVFQAAQMVEVKWDKAVYPQNSDDFFQTVEQSFANEFEDSQHRNDGDVTTVLNEAGSHVLSMEYGAPFLAHATMEPMNATVLLKDNRLDIWAGNQNPTQAKKEGIALTGLNESQVHVHTLYLGGGFGRRAEMDFIKYAVILAKQMEGVPVKVTWTREEDMTHDAYRPLAMARGQGHVENGQIEAFDLHLAAPSVMASQMGRINLPTPGPDITIVQAAWDQPYQIPHYRVTGYRVPNTFPISSWRSVGASQNGFFHECMIDELAFEAGTDPLQLRLNSLQHLPSKKVVEAVAELSNWGRKLPEGHGLGIAYVMSFGVPVAEVVEVANTPSGIKIINAFAAVDVGIALDPINIEAQVISGLNFGLAAAIMGEITLNNGLVEQTNFHQFDSLRINQAPNIQVKILEHGEKIRGIGEPATPPAAPALANAIFAATGQRIRHMPLNKFIKFV